MVVKKHPYDPNDVAGWLALRKSLDRVGGSELGVIAGHSPYKSAYSLYCEKAGLVDAEDISDKEAIIQGHDLEQYVAERFTRTTGKSVSVYPYILTNSEYPNLEATIDRKVEDENSGLECKTMQSLVMRKFSNGDFPMAYYDQCVQYLAVSCMDRWYLAILVYGTAFKIFMMTREKSEYERYSYLKSKVEGASELSNAEQKDWAENFGWLESVCYISDDEIAACETIAKVFMDRVRDFRNGNMEAWPIDEIDGSQSTRKALIETSPLPEPKSVVTFDGHSEYGVQEDGNVFVDVKASDLISLVTQHTEIVQTIDDLNDVKKQVENRIISIMREKEIFNTPKCKVTFKMVSGRKNASWEAVEAYFHAEKKDIPQGMITKSKDSRQLRFYAKS